jgi:hypothetical protein
VRGNRLAVSLATTTVLMWMVVPAGPASATISAPCTGQINGVDVTADHDTAGSAVDIDYKSEVAYSGQSSSGDVVAVKVTLELAGVGIRSHEALTSGATWSDSVAIEKYAWAGVGLYRVRGEATSSSGPLCTGTAYICITGRSPFLTVAGIVSIVLIALGLVVLLRALMVRRRSSRGGMATRFGFAGVLGGLGVPLILQQSCTVALTQNVAAGSVGGGLLGMAILGLLAGVSRKREAKKDEAKAAAPPPPPPPPRPSDDRALVYRFSAPEDACNACKNHAAHRTYRTQEAITPDRAHPGCHCEIVTEPRQRREVVALFAGRGDVVDDRGS